MHAGAGLRHDGGADARGLSELERVLRQHPSVWQDAVIVRFKEFGSSSLDIEIMAWFLTRDYGEFQLLRQGVLLEFMGVVERAGSSFAFPTRTLHIASGRDADAGAPGAPGAPPAEPTSRRA